MRIVQLLLISPIFHIECNNYSSLPWKKGYHGMELNIVEKFLPKNPIILEAGVCNGSDTCKMKDKWPEATIYGFEALPKHFAMAKENTKHLSGVYIYHYALFDKIGHLTFYSSAKIPAASSLLVDNFNNIKPNSSNYEDNPIVVECTTLDEWAKLQNIKKIDYMWLDAEGAELYILGSAKTILPTVKAISTEVNFKEFRVGMTLFPQLYQFLTEHNFELISIWGRADWQATAVFINKSSNN